MNYAQLDGPHWDFSLAVYMTPGVDDACINLQDQYGVDINVLLIALWATCERSVEVDAARIAELDHISAELRTSVIKPLRNARRWMKTVDLGPDKELARNAVKKAELAAEQLQLGLLAGLVEEWPSQTVHPGGVSSTAQAVVAYFSEHSGSSAKLDNSLSLTARVARAAAQRT